MDNEKHEIVQWLFFQASGQGPYFGQVVWFTIYHPEKVPSAVERYRNEIRRVVSVLESVLSKKEWLVGGRPTIADLSFIPYVHRSLPHDTDSKFTDCCVLGGMRQSFRSTSTLTSRRSSLQFLRKRSFCSYQPLANVCT